MEMCDESGGYVTPPSRRSKVDPWAPKKTSRTVLGEIELEPSRIVLGEIEHEGTKQSKSKKVDKGQETGLQGASLLSEGFNPPFNSTTIAEVNEASAVAVASALEEEEEEHRRYNSDELSALGESSDEGEKEDHQVKLKKLRRRLFCDSDNEADGPIGGKRVRPSESAPRRRRLSSSCHSARVLVTKAKKIRGSIQGVLARRNSAGATPLELKLRKLHRQLQMQGADIELNTSVLEYFLEDDKLACLTLGSALVPVAKCEAASYQSTSQYADKPPECPIAVIARQLSQMKTSGNGVKNKSASKRCRETCQELLKSSRMGKAEA